jgi:hypothetical protein
LLATLPLFEIAIVFLKFPERQKALHSLLLPDSLEADAILTASSIRCRTRGWFAFDPASFCEKTQI